MHCVWCVLAQTADHLLPTTALRPLWYWLGAPAASPASSAPSAAAAAPPSLVPAVVSVAAPSPPPPPPADHRTLVLAPYVFLLHLLKHLRGR